MSEKALSNQTVAAGGGCMNYVVAAGLVLLTLSPIDLIPDFIPVVGLLDDLGYIVGVIAAIRAAYNKQ